MPSYDLIQDFGVADPTSGELITVDPHWVLAVVRFKFPLTFSRDDQSSFSTLFEDAVQMRGEPLIISDSCVQLTCSTNKSSHLTEMTAALLPHDRFNWMSEILPGDWVFAWMVNDKASADRVTKALKQGQPANGYNDGFKFMGRVNSVRKSLTQSPDGFRSVHYNINGTGFGEFDATLFYDPRLAERQQAIGKYFARLGTNLNKLIAQNGQGVGVLNAILFFLDVLLGQGVPQSLGRLNDDSRLRSTAGLDAPFAYIIPAAVGSIIGKTDKTKPGGLLSAADTLEVLYGLQHYDDIEISDDQRALISEEGADASAVQAGQLFNPKGARNGGNRRWTGNDLLGIFNPQEPQFTDKSVWTVLNQYLNPSVNEMYTCLRVNPFGSVVPTLVVRQLPFSTERAPKDIEVTRFLELPRWKIHSHLVRSADVGRSDSLRLNFIHVYGDVGAIKNNRFTEQVVQWPPYRDDLDIARSGLHPYSITIPCAIADIRNGSPQKWMSLLSDFLIGQQLTLTGVLDLVGIQAPICPGDNLEWDGVVFHIESVSHTCSISQDGRKTFSTNISVSHGLAAQPTAGDLGIYAGLSSTSLRDLEPGLTVEGDNLNEQQDAIVDPASPGADSAVANDTEQALAVQQEALNDPRG
jgi:hypothetical protein